MIRYVLLPAYDWRELRVGIAWCVASYDTAELRAARELLAEGKRRGLDCAVLSLGASAWWFTDEQAASVLGTSFRDGALDNGWRFLDRGTFEKLTALEGERTECDTLDVSAHEPCFIEWSCYPKHDDTLIATGNLSLEEAIGDERAA